VGRRHAGLILAGLILFLLTAGCDAPRPVQLLVGDQQLAALYWEPPRRLSPAVLLLPAEGGKKEDWLPLAARLHQGGYGVLALDWSRHDTAGREALLADAHAGFEFLRAQKKVDAARIGLVGAELGASVALDFAAREPLARLVVLLSPLSDGEWEPAGSSMRDYGFRPLLLLANREDIGSRPAISTLAEAAQGHTEAEVWSGSFARGTQMLTDSPDMSKRILEFLRAYL
jgi:dienelactone hydrolase